MASANGTTRGVSVLGSDIHATARIAEAADRAGLDAAWTSEFYFRSAVVSLAEMAHRTERCRVGSSIAYGVGRTPIVLAAEARDLDEISGGRLVLGLGNGTRRMMSDWHGVDPSSPALRIEELVPLLRRIWRIHQGPIQHEGRFYRINLFPMGDFPPPQRERIPVYTAGVNPRMIEAAGRVSDGLVGHPLFTVKYVEEVARPAIEKGAAHAERDPSAVEVTSMVICSIHDDPEVARREAAAQIAFYAAVKTYRRAMDVNGFGEEHGRIRSAFERGDLEGMTAAVTDEMVDVMSCAGTAAEVRSALKRYEGPLDHILLYSPSVGMTAERIEENTMSLISECGG